MQGRPEEVVAALAALGIAVSEGQVRAVSLEMLRQAARAERPRAEVAMPSVLRPLRVFARVPSRRSRRWHPSASGEGCSGHLSAGGGR